MENLEKIEALQSTLRRRLEPLALGRFPTPAERISEIPGISAQLWVKRDDACSTFYGGNKVRKLEFLLAQAERRGIKHIITFGAVGSNHALACGAHGGMRGLDVHVVVLPQPLTKYVRKNLLAAHGFGVDLHHASNPASAVLTALALRARLSGKGGVALIPPGGSNVLGSMGYVLAVLELTVQIARGEAPLPAKIFVPVGSGGTLAGLLAGAALVGLPAQFVGIQVVSPIVANAVLVGSLARRTFLFCKAILPERLRPARMRFPRAEFRSGYFGGGYGRPTEEGMSAISRASEIGLSLDPTYTGKTFAAVIDEGRKRGLSGRALLFWNTYSSVDLGKRVESVDWRTLPKALHRYFDGSLQAADE